jgi:hypothetical protein
MNVYSVFIFRIQQAKEIRRLKLKVPLTSHEFSEG